MRTLFAIVVAGCLACVACGGGSKPPMQPDNDTSSLDDGGAAPAPAPATSGH
jgi:hypothetical protein